MRDKQRKIIYNKVFGNELGKVVLADLRAICFATMTTSLKDLTGKIDPYQMAIMEGRRQVFLEIMKMMKIDFEDLYDLTNEDLE